MITKQIYALLFKSINWALNTVSAQDWASFPSRFVVFLTSFKTQEGQTTSGNFFPPLEFFLDFHLLNGLKKFETITDG